MKRNLCEMFGKLCTFSLVVLAATGCGVEQLEPEQEGKPVTPEEVRTLESAIAYGGHDYLFVTTPKSWEEAQTYCQLAGGYSLVTINDASEEAVLQTQEFHRGLYNWWIGANDKGIEGVWVWSNGTSSYTNWSPGEPNNSGNMEDCAADRFSYAPAGIYDERWNDSACSTPFPFICERDSVPTDIGGSFPYSASNTADATGNTTTYSLYLYAGQVLTVGTCGVEGATGSGDTYLRIKDPHGEELAHNDDAGWPCDLLSNISRVVPETGTYIIHAGCFSSGTCGGTVAFTY